VVTKIDETVVGLFPSSALGPMRERNGRLAYILRCTSRPVSRRMRQRLLLGSLRHMVERRAPVMTDPRPPLARRITPSQWEAIDVAVALGLAAIVVPLLASLGHEVSRHLPVWAQAVLGLAATLPLAVRRRWPLAVLGVVTVPVAVAAGFGSTFGPDPMIALAVYMVATQYDRRRSLGALAVVETALVTALLVAESAFSKGDTFSPVVAAAAWFVGDAVRARRAYAAGLAEQAEQRQREELERARRAVVEERVRVARELHDVLAHSLSVVAIQAGVGRHVLDSQPEETRRALAAVEAASRDALAELRQVVGLLRQDERPALALSPAPGLADLGRLVDQVRSAGVPVELDVTGEPTTLPPGIELSVYRVVQEALTNVVKHAGPARARVVISYGTDTIDVEIVDTGRGCVSSSGEGNEALSPHSSVPRASTDDGTGDGTGHHGIIGMRERVALFGGSLSVGPGSKGGFRVAAHIPVVARGGAP
jgi:signal transduction histidine kinase